MRVRGVRRGELRVRGTRRLDVALHHGGGVLGEGGRTSSCECVAYAVASSVYAAHGALMWRCTTEEVYLGKGATAPWWISATTTWRLYAATVMALRYVAGAVIACERHAMRG